jgi:hypothetical protein
LTTGESHVAGRADLDVVPAGPARICSRWRRQDDLLAHPVQIGAEPDQHLSGDALALADQAEQDALVEQHDELLRREDPVALDHEVTPYPNATTTDPHRHLGQRQAQSVDPLDDVLRSRYRRAHATTYRPNAARVAAAVSLKYSRGLIKPHSLNATPFSTARR